MGFGPAKGFLPQALQLEDAVKRSPILLVLALTAGLSPRASAHHRFADVYRVDTEITIEGEVTAWVYADPHSFIHVAADGRVRRERWIVEAPGAAFWRQQGVTAETFRPGQRVIVTGNPGRVSAHHRLRLREIVRPGDGWKWDEAGR